MATGTDYTEIRKKLYFTAKLLDCCKLCVNCYRHLIEYVFGGMNIPCRGMTVGEFADRHPLGTYLIRIKSHITCIKNGKCYDIWDCRDQECDVAWRIFKKRRVR